MEREEDIFYKEFKEQVEESFYKKAMDILKRWDWEKILKEEKEKNGPKFIR